MGANGGKNGNRENVGRGVILHKIDCLSIFFSSLKSLIPQCEAENKNFCQTCFPNYILENGKKKF